MAVLDDRFVRAKFESQNDPHELSLELERELTRQMVQSKKPEQTARWLIHGLKHLGHDLYLLDDGEGWEYWTDNWVQQTSSHALGVEFRYPPSPETQTRVLFVPRAQGRGARRCPVCNVEMQGTYVWFEVQGHGSATAPSVRVIFSFGDEITIEQLVGARSFGPKKIGGYLCPRCKGCWFPPERTLVPGT